MMETGIIDSHAHYDDQAFDSDREALLESLNPAGICLAVNVSSSLESVKTTIALTERYSFLYGSAGVHPSETEGLTEEDVRWMEEQCSHPKIVAVGEIGLDYHWDTPERKLQQRWLERQIRMAGAVGLPLIIHSRDAAADTLRILKEHHGEETGGVIHCFSYGKEMAREYLNMGYYIGIGGVLTYKNAKKLKEVAEYVPLDRILLETDCPYLSPTPVRHKRNSSLNLPYVAKELARIKGISPQEVIAVTAENAKTLYRIP